MPDLLEVVNFAKSLGFGGFVGSSLAMVLYPRFLKDFCTIQEATCAGAVVGAGLHRVFSGIIHHILGPISKFASLYAKIYQLYLLGRTPLLTKKRRDELVGKLIEKTFS